MKPLGECPDCKGEIDVVYPEEKLDRSLFAICSGCGRNHPIERFWDTYIEDRRLHKMEGLRCKKCKHHSIVEGELTREKICLLCRSVDSHEKRPDVFENKPDNTNPSHYKLPKGLQVIDITRNETFPIGNAIKYILRRKDKGDEIGDIRKAIWYLYEELERLGKDKNPLKK